MLEAKKRKIRQQMRQERLNAIFQLRRMELLQGLSGIFEQLNIQINESCSSEYNTCLLTSKLITLLNQHEDQQNTYVVVGNFLMNHWDQLTYFLDRICQSPKYLDSYYYVMFVMVNILYTMLRQKQKNQQDSFSAISGAFQTIAVTMNKGIATLIRKLASNEEYNRKDEIIWRYFIQIFKIFSLKEVNEKFPVEVLANYNLVLNKIHLRKIFQKQTQILSIWTLITWIINRSSQIAYQPAYHEFLYHSYGVFDYILHNSVQQRQVAIELLEDVISTNPVKFIQIFVTKTLMKELIFLMDQAKGQSETIVKIFVHIIPQCNLSQIFMLTQLGIHRTLARTLGWSIVNKKDQSISNCLEAIYITFKKLEDDWQNKKLKRIKREIEEEEFYQMIAGLWGNKQNAIIENFLQLIAGDYYSEEQNI